MKEINKPKIKELIWLFMIGSFLGFILETIWHLIKYNEYINKQGLLYGPFKPIYGFGLILIIITMYKLINKSFITKFIIGIIIGSTFEYLGSIFQEYVFGTSTWDYTSFNLNLSGRIYLPYCLAWGLIACLCLDFLYPHFKKYFSKIPRKIANILTFIIFIFFFINIILTAIATIRYSKRTTPKYNSNTVFKVIDQIYNNEYMQKKFPKMSIITKN